MQAIPGVGPDAPIHTDPVTGAKQSASPYRLDLIPPLSLLDVAAVLAHGAAKYGVDNWRGIPVSDHLNHALVHIYAFLSGDTQDNHLGHAACRMMMAHEQQLIQERNDKLNPPGADFIRCTKCTERFTRKFITTNNLTACTFCNTLFPNV